MIKIKNKKMIKKTVYASIIIALGLSGTAFAQSQNSEQHERELNDILRILEGRENVEIKEEKPEEPAPRRRIRIETPQIVEVPEAENEEPKSQFMTQMGGIDSYEHVYLLNIPIGTEIYFENDFFVPPYRDGIIYQHGNIQSRSPLFDNLINTFCYFNINESGFVRRFKGNENNTLVVESNFSTSDQFVDEDDNAITLYQTTLYFEHDHIDNLRCLTTEKNLPLNIGDLNRETGYIMKFIFPEVVDI